MDVQMPILDGYEATKKIREYETFQNVSSETYIVGLTAHSSDMYREAATECGMNEFSKKNIWNINFSVVTKPVEIK